MPKYSVNIEIPDELVKLPDPIDQKQWRNVIDQALDQYQEKKLKVKSLKDRQEARKKYDSELNKLAADGVAKQKKIRDVSTNLNKALLGQAGMAIKKLPDQLTEKFTKVGAEKQKQVKKEDDKVLDAVQKSALSWAAKNFKN
ncbi:MAG: hypothetical protein WBS20_04335 [Lysobacterales bacterium]